MTSLADRLDAAIKQLEGVAQPRGNVAEAFDAFDTAVAELRGVVAALRADDDQLNEARWAACNTRWDEGAVPSMEKATEVADNAVRAYLGLDVDEWDAAPQEDEL